MNFLDNKVTVEDAQQIRSEIVTQFKVMAKKRGRRR